MSYLTYDEVHGLHSTFDAQRGSSYLCENMTSSCVFSDHLLDGQPFSHLQTQRPYTCVSADHSLGNVVLPKFLQAHPRMHIEY